MYASLAWLRVAVGDTPLLLREGYQDRITIGDCLSAAGC